MYSIWNSVLPCVLLCLFSSIAVASSSIQFIEIEEEKATTQEGSCVKINCKYMFKDNMQLLWIKDPKWNAHEHRFDGTIVYSNTKERPQVSEYSGRVEYDATKYAAHWASCTLTINYLQKKDSGNYTFRYIKGDLKYKSNEFSLTVTDNPCQIHIKPSNLTKSLKEGDNVSLHCVTSAACGEYPYWLGIPDSSKVVKIEDKGNEEISSELKLTMSWRDDGKTLRCRPLRSNDRCLDRIITLRVEHAPKETKVIDRSSSVDVKEGEQVTISCSSKAQPKASYTWFKNESSFSHAGETFTLNIMTPDDGGIFYCQAKNEHGSENSLGIKINVIYAPKGVNIGSQSTDLKEGDQLTLTCSVKKSNPAVEVQSYKWYRNEQEIFDQTMSTFTVYSVTRSDTGRYKCQARNSVGETKSANSFKVSVKYFPQNTHIQGTSGIKLGSNLHLTCVSEADPIPLYHWWYFKPEDKQGFLDLSNLNEDYKINNVDVSNAGVYKCSAQNAIGPGANSSEFNLLVFYPPKEPNLIMNEVVKENELFTITCTVESSPQAILTLKRASLPNQERDITIRYWHQSNVLNFTTKASVSDAGVYTCAAKNTEGESVSKNRNLQVRYAPRNVYVSAHPGEVLKEGSNLELTCNAESVPQVSEYTWIKSFSKPPVTVGHGQKITLYFLNRSDSDHYFCIAINEIGSGSSPPVHIRVKYQPHIKIIHNITSLGLWETKIPVHLSCSVQCYPPATSFEWHKLEENTIVLSRDQNYTVQPENPGMYYCYAGNTEGNSRSEPVEIYTNRYVIEQLVLVIIIFSVIIFLIGVIFLIQRILRKRSFGKNQRAQQSFFFSAAPLWSFSNLRSLGSDNNTRENLVMEGSTELSGFRGNHSAMAVHSNPPANSNIQARRPNSNIHTVYDAVRLPPSMPKQHHQTEEDVTTVNYAMLQFTNSKNPNKSIQSHHNCGPVYAEVSKNKQMAKKQQGGHEDYENVSGACVPKQPYPNINWDSDSSESEEEVNYTKVSFTVTSHHNPQRNVFGSDEEDKTEYSEVKI